MPRRLDECCARVAAFAHARVALALGGALAFGGAGCVHTGATAFERLALPANLPEETAACDRGEIEACHALALRYHAGNGVAQSGERAVAFAQRACALGHDDHCSWADTIRGRRESYAASVTSCLKPHLALVPRAGRPAQVWESGPCPDLGLRLLYGADVDADPALALRVFAQSCEAGDPDGCAALGYVRLFGVAAARDEAAGLALLHGACRDGSAAGYAYLGLAYEEGAGGLAADVTTAREYYEIGCPRGPTRDSAPLACFRLARLIDRGLGGAHRPEERNAAYKSGCYAHDPAIAVESCRRAIALGALPEGAEFTGYWYARVEDALKPSCARGARDLCLLVPR